VAVAGVASVGAIGAVLLAGILVERAQEARFVAEWEEQTPRLVAAVEQVRMPNGYERIDCDIEPGTVASCWRTSLAPEGALPDVEDALSAAGLNLVTSECERMTNGTVLGCSAQGIPYERDPDALVERVVGATAHWDTAPLRDTPGEGSIVRVAALVELPTA
jgi:hypothetical protein